MAVSLTWFLFWVPLTEVVVYFSFVCVEVNLGPSQPIRVMLSAAVYLTIFLPGQA